MSAWNYWFTCILGPYELKIKIYIFVELTILVNDAIIDHMGFKPYLWGIFCTFYFKKYN